MGQPVTNFNFSTQEINVLHVRTSLCDIVIILIDPMWDVNK